MKLAALSPALKAEVQEFLKLGIPLASAQVAQAMTGFVDTLMMGRLGQTSLAAGGLAVMVFMACVMTGIGIVSSVTSLAAEAYGANRPRRVGEVTRQGLWLAVLITVPVWPLLANFSQVMPALGQDPEVIALTHTYLTIARWGFLPALWFG
ncbi:MAG: MATE family efflux transporter, partial [Cyanobacteria bacterium P01_D01_bin.115]